MFSTWIVSFASGPTRGPHCTAYLSIVVFPIRPIGMSNRKCTGSVLFTYKMTIPSWSSRILPENGGTKQFLHQRFPTYHCLPYNRLFLWELNFCCLWECFTIANKTLGKYFSFYLFL